jgi:hypothetical protein
MSTLSPHHGSTVEREAASRRPGWDALLLALLVFALLQITGLAEQAALPTRLQDVLRHPILGNLLPAAGEAAMGDIGPRPGEPVGLVLNALTLALLLLYLLVDLGLARRRQVPWKSWLLAGILLTALFLPATKLILLRQGSGPASYTHDGGVIQTEATVRFLLEGKNPYVEDYTATPMAEWGFSRYRTALYHYPYLPWTFLFSAPFYLAGQAAGFYDQRLVYLLLLAVALALAPLLVQSARAKLALVMLLGLNPIMALDVIFGQNDSFVLGWLIFSLVAWARWRRRQRRGERGGWMLALSTVCFGLACASKPTAWFLAPFYALLLVADLPLTGSAAAGLGATLRQLLRRAWPGALAFLLIVLPYVIWDPAAIYDDTWRWSSGQGETGYQIWGWGGSNFVLALGLVADRFAQWPFWVPMIALATPLLLWLLWRQVRANTLSNACWHYGLFMLGFFYASRFLNENYLGYILAFLAIGILAALPADERTDPT